MKQLTTDPFAVAEFRDMRGKIIGTDSQYHAHVREILGVGGPGDWMDISVPGE